MVKRNEVVACARHVTWRVCTVQPSTPTRLLQAGGGVAGGCGGGERGGGDGV